MAIAKRTKTKKIKEPKIVVAVLMTVKQKAKLVKMKKAYEKESATKCSLSAFVFGLAMGEIHS